MKVSGFTFIRNAIPFDYPIVEAIQSILPLCDEVVVAVGNSDDDTLREGGTALAHETNKALAGVVHNCDWCIYIQGDEVLHEDGYAEIRHAMQGNLHREDVDGLLFSYRHFYGSYDYVGASANWYRNEIRIIKPGRGIHSFRDAQGFRKPTNQKLHVVRLEACMHHYGWVKEPKATQQKQESFHKMWHDHAWVASNVIASEAYDYGKDLRHLVRFGGTIPKGMHQRIARVNWHFDADISMDQRSIKTDSSNFVTKSSVLS